MATQEVVQTIVPYATYNGVTKVVAMGYRDSAASAEIEPMGMTASGLYIITNEEVFPVGGSITMEIELVDTGWGDGAGTKTAIASILAASPTTIHVAAGYYVTVFSAEASLQGVDLLIDHPLPAALKVSFVFSAHAHEFAAAAYFVEQGRAAI